MGCSTSLNSAPLNAGLFFGPRRRRLAAVDRRDPGRRQPAARAAAVIETPTLRARCGRSARGGHSEDNLAYPNPCQFDILQPVRAGEGPNALRSIKPARLDHAARRRGGRLFRQRTRATARPSLADRHSSWRAAGRFNRRRGLSSAAWRTWLFRGVKTQSSSTGGPIRRIVFLYWLQR